jgi:hypothetical protein
MLSPREKAQRGEGTVASKKNLMATKLMVA